MRAKVEGHQPDLSGLSAREQQQILAVMRAAEEQEGRAETETAGGEQHGRRGQKSRKRAERTFHPAKFVALT